MITLAIFIGLVLFYLYFSTTRPVKQPDGVRLVGYTICFKGDGVKTYLKVTEVNFAGVYRILNTMEINNPGTIDKAIIVDDIIYMDPSLTKEGGASLRTIW